MASSELFVHIQCVFIALFISLFTHCAWMVKSGSYWPALEASGSATVAWEVTQITTNNRALGSPLVSQLKKPENKLHRMLKL